ncbi:hypothetical protein [Crocosphaera sp.]|uniref:hypothetical protein n=1 Tax=Crocosphaera sp. TaxID=2729996 RepID=UPI003F226E8A
MSKKALFWFSTLVIISSNIVVSATTPSLKNNLNIITKIDKTKENIDNKTYNSTSYLGQSSGSPDKVTEIANQSDENKDQFLRFLIRHPAELLTIITFAAGIYQYIYDRKKQQMIEQLKAKVYKSIIQKNRENKEEPVKFSQIRKHFYKKIAEEYNPHFALLLSDTKKTKKVC